MHTPLDRRKALVFVIASLVRLLLFSFPNLPDLLTGRVEISTPVTSFKRLKEGVFLYTHNVSPYDGGVYHQAPLLLPIFSLIPSTLFSTATKLLYILLDLLSAHALTRIADSGLARDGPLFTSPRADIKWDGASIAAAYLFNPFILATCIGRPTNIFTNLSILISLANACARKPMTAMLFLGLASYLALYPALLLPPLTLLCYDRYTQPPQNLASEQNNTDDKAQSKSSIWSFAAKHVSLFFSSVACLLSLSRLLTGSWAFIPSTYGVQLLLPDLTPNVGLWWYFFIEMFDSFREFFLGVFWLHLGGYVGGLCIRLRKQPLFAITTMMGIFAVFKPYPSVGDTGVYLSLLMLYRHVFPLMRYTFLSLSTILYTSLLGPAFYHLWIYAGSGNANFFYAITLVWSLGQVLLIADSLFAVLRDEWEIERPEMRGKEVRQI